ncbi:glycoside hydrolase domain-containing protein [Streptomyces sp. NPDC091263]|uniref:glycoside hydrolase domain-containing protein n=1 Tax=Streptomyces sp. NPDC091263 TaxID=3155194 RepID=UPI00344D9B9A
MATTLFSPTPDGEPGNDDLGAQSSWYVWAALGLYPSTPGTPDLTVHSPLFERAVLDLPGRGADLDIRAPEAAADTPYVHDLKLDGRDWERTYLPRSTVHDGGRLDFSLSGTPDTHWATSAQAAPPSYRAGERSFLANATPNGSTVEPGGKGAAVKVSGQRLAGHDRTLTVTADPPKGLTVSAEKATMKLGAAGSGSTALTVTAGAETPEGYYEVPLTVRGSGHTDPVRLSATVLVAPQDSLSAAYDSTGLSDDADHGQGDFDGDGNSYSRQALAAAGLRSGARAEVSGTTFTWPAAPQGRPDNVAADGRTIGLGEAAEDARRLLFVGSSTDGDHKGSATVTFADGSTAEADLSFGDWTMPGGGSGPVLGNALVARTDHRNQSGGSGPAAYVFATTPFDVPEGKQVKSVTLPHNPDLHVFAVGLG